MNNESGLMTQLREFLRKPAQVLAWLAEKVSDHLPWFMVFASLLVVAWVWLLPAFELVEQAPADAEKLGQVALVVLGTGFFAWLTKGSMFRKVLSQQLGHQLGSEAHRAMLAGTVHAAIASESASEPLREALRKELSNIVLSISYLSTRKDLVNVLERVMEATGTPPSLARLAGSAILRTIWDQTRPYYIEHATRIHRLRWLDRAAGKLHVVTEYRGRLKNARPGVEFTRVGMIVENSLARFDTAPRTIRSQIVDIESKQEFCANYRRDLARDKVWVSEVSLPGSCEFAFDESWEYVQDVDCDNMVAYEAPVYVNGLTIEVDFDSNEMTVLRIDVGAMSLEPSNGAIGGKRWHVKDLIRPGGAYIFTIQRVERGS
jgi:hypothetical protein